MRQKWEAHFSNRLAPSGRPVDDPKSMRCLDSTSRFPFLLLSLATACVSGGEGKPGPSGTSSLSTGSGAASGGSWGTGGNGSGSTASDGGSTGGAVASGGADTTSSGATSSTGGMSTGSGGSLVGDLDRTAAEVVAAWTLGWNLGNALDVPASETDWGNPVITRELLQAVANAGFDVVRIPVTWSLFTSEGPDYLLDSSRLDRVEEVVGYARDAGLMAIINIHHDGADGFTEVEWLTLDDMSGAVEERFEAVWEQIAARFSDHDGQLIFESMNEIHDGYPSLDNPPPQAHYDMINGLNQLFVDVVRSSGGNNAQRHLVVPGYNTDIDLTLDGFETPNDPASDRLILSVHYYSPYQFALEASTSAWGAASAGNDGYGQEDYVRAQFDRLVDQYVSDGLPVIIGEYGATNHGGSGEYRRYYMEYVTKAAIDRGIVPIYWDNGGLGTGAENLGLFDRSNNSIAFPNILEAMVRAATSDYTLDQVALPSP